MTKQKKDQSEILKDEVLEEKPLEVKKSDSNEAEASADEQTAEEAPEEILKEIVQEDEQVLNRLIRLQADFENFKKRTLKEKAEIYSFAMENLITKLIPVMDNLERAEASFDGAETEGQTYVNGVQMVFKQLKDVLKEEGLAEIDCDKSFDPNFHHGVAVGEDPEKEDQDILEVFQKGYSFKGKVIRPAMVKICNK
ncbi:nucleotide exchange factor GrpE [Acetobacterium sp.]|uniref:nucleotide exchange factor GrpE n=1 Tax=Acetobacterium sp. TaxID=1872094 RepID=UPI002F3F1015